VPKSVCKAFAVSAKHLFSIEAGISLLILTAAVNFLYMYATTPIIRYIHTHKEACSTEDITEAAVNPKLRFWDKTHSRQIFPHRGSVMKDDPEAFQDGMKELHYMCRSCAILAGDAKLR